MKNKINSLFQVNDTTKSYQIYQVIRLISLVLISIILVKSSYSTNETSAFELFLFVINIGTFFWVMGLSNAMLSYYPTLSKQEKESFFKSVFSVLQTLGFIVSIIVLLSNAFGLGNNNNIFDNKTINLLSLYIFLYSPTIIIEMKYLLQNEYKKLFWYGLTLFSLQFIIIILAIILYRDIYYLFIGLCFWIFIRWIWSVYLVFGDNRNYKISIKLIKTFSLFSLPLIAHIFLGNGMEFIDGVLVESNFSGDMFSIYRYGAREFPIILILIGAIRTSMIPKAIKNIDESANIIKIKTTKIINFFFPLAIILMFSSKYIFTLVYSSEYIYSALLFNIYLLIISSRIILAEVFIYSKHLNTLLMKVSLIEVISNIILSIILMQYFGIAGIAFATFIAFMGSKIFLVWYTSKKLGISIDKYIDLKPYLLLTFLLYISFVITLII